MKRREFNRRRKSGVPTWRWKNLAISLDGWICRYGVDPKNRPQKEVPTDGEVFSFGTITPLVVRKAAT